MTTKDMEESPKLSILKEIAEQKLKSRCALVRKKREVNVDEVERRNSSIPD